MSLKILYNVSLIIVATTVFLLTAASFAFRATPLRKPAIYYPKQVPNVTIMQIDTGIDYNIDALGSHVPERYHSIDYMDFNGHGTHVAGIILKDTCDSIKLIPCRFYPNAGDKTDDEALQREIACLKLAADDKIDIVNFSAGGQYPNAEELKALRVLDSKNTIVVVSAGNDGHQLTISNKINKTLKYLEKCNDLTTCKDQKFYYYPASYKLQNLLKVSNYHNGDLIDGSNFAEGFLKADGHMISSYYLGGTNAFMSGTSQSAASVTNKILKDMCKILN